MCGLFGYFDANNTDRDYTSLVKALGIASQVRGTDATGVAFNLHGRKLEIIKQPVPATKFNFDVPKGVKCVMGHVRAATRGDAKANYNNHPFRGRIKNRQFALAHNGVLWNLYTTRQLYELPKTQIETDSYIAVQLLEREKTLNTAAIKSMAEKLDGSYTITILDDKDRLWFIKGDNPLAIVKLKGGLYVYASTLEILMQGLVNWDRNVVTRISELIEPKYGEIVCLNHGRLTTSTFEPSVGYSYYRYGWSRYADELDEVPAPVPSTEEEKKKLEEIYLGADYMGIDRKQIDVLVMEGLSLDEILEAMQTGDIYYYTY